MEERRKLLAREKELMRLHDQVARERRALPWRRIAKEYVSTRPRAGARWPSSSTGAAS
jgi:predicted dithiol-disulfide oxidoreductase (DUF899 family)